MLTGFRNWWSRTILGRETYEARQRRLADRAPQDIFETIYREKMWGGRSLLGRFYSGSGSHADHIVRPYVEAVRGHVSRMPQKPRIVDIGCGDFHVGRQLVGLASSYLACDIVRPLIDSHRTKFRQPGLEFRVLDAINEPLPDGDLALIRQVLQHLNNAEVAAIVAKLPQYRSVIVTEHLPTGDFEPNLDKATGVDTRLRDRSGLVLTEPPFGLRPRLSQVICEVPEHGGVIRTVAYAF